MSVINHKVEDIYMYFKSHIGLCQNWLLLWGKKFLEWERLREFIQIIHFTDKGNYLVSVDKYISNEVSLLLTSSILCNYLI